MSHHPSSWMESAVRLGRLLPQAAAHPAVLRWAEARPADETWGAGFSGGADSLALLLWLWVHWPERRGRLVGLHFNHGLRAAESDGDEAFCREACAGLGVEFRAGRWTDRPATVSEAAARTARRAFFELALGVAGGRALWLGQQANDVAETLLMRLARGSGTAGLAAPRPVRLWPGGLVQLRPLLTCPGEKIRAALGAAGVVWRDDSSNVTGDFYRNRVRADVVPAWIATAPNDALAGVLRSRELLEEDDAALEAWLDGVLGGGGEAELDLRLLKGRPRALWRRALHRWLAAVDAGGEFSREGFEQLMDGCLRGGFRRMSAGAKGFAKIEDGRLGFQPTAATAGPWTEMELPPDGRLTLPDGAEVGASRATLTPERRGQILHGAFSPGETAWLDAAKLGAAALRVRPWRPGDRYRPLGAPGAAKLQDLFVNRKIPGDRRAVLPVFVSGGQEIVWVPELPPAERVKIDAQTNSAVQLTYQPGTSSVNR